MKIVKVARHGCVRVAKEAMPLLDRGYDVHIISNKLPMFGEFFKSSTIYQNTAQLEDAIKLHGDADVFHCHNEPSWFVTVVKQVLPHVPVVLDVHDSMLIRVEPDDESQVRISVDERNNLKLSDAHVFVSNGMSLTCREEFHLDQPCIVLPSYVPRSLYRFDSWQWLGGLVYEGRIDLPEEIEKEEMPFFKYCEYTALSKALSNAGIKFNLYTPRSDERIQKHYGDNAIWQGSYPFDQLIRKLGRHDWGLVGNIDYHPAWQYAMPNKLFEYMAAGIPIVALNAKAAGEFVEDLGIGMSVETVDDIRRRWDERDKCRKTLIECRYDWCMDEHIYKLEDLYDNIIR